MKNLTQLIALTLATAFLPGTTAIAAIKPPTIKMDQSFQPAHYRNYRHRHRNRELRRERRRERSRHYHDEALPQAHIDYCIRQNMDYNPSNNSIALDRWTRGQCASPYFRR